MSTRTQDGNQQTTAPVRAPSHRRPATRRQPPYHVVLLDDDDHTYDYVIGMIRRLFGYEDEKALELAAEVDGAGRVILDTTTLERAELKRDQIHTFGRDWRIDRCRGCMSAVIERAPSLQRSFGVDRNLLRQRGLRSARESPLKRARG
ncbi:MAG: ATP-dependent Clp protease adaptor ClpS [Phycisphaerae bacterium]